MLPASLKEIGYRAFTDCSSLTYVVFSEGSRIERIGGYCFSGTKIVEITLPKSLKYVGNYAFRNCRDLKTVYLEDGRDILFSRLGISSSTQVGPVPGAKIGN